MRYSVWGEDTRAGASVGVSESEAAEAVARRSIDIHACPSMIAGAGLAEDEREVVGVMQTRAYQRLWGLALSCVSVG